VSSNQFGKNNFIKKNPPSHHSEAEMTEIPIVPNSPQSKVLPDFKVSLILTDV
jgi:hypothetical protein